MDITSETMYVHNKHFEIVRLQLLLRRVQLLAGMFYSKFEWPSKGTKFDSIVTEFPVILLLFLYLVIAVSNAKSYVNINPLITYS